MICIEDHSEVTILAPNAGLVVSLQLLCDHKSHVHSAKIFALCRMASQDSSFFILFLNYGLLVGTQQVDYRCSGNSKKLLRVLQYLGTRGVGAPVHKPGYNYV